jgi:hypothetical protein
MINGTHATLAEFSDDGILTKDLASEQIAGGGMRTGVIHDSKPGLPVALFCLKRAPRLSMILQ